MRKSLLALALDSAFGISSANVFYTPLFMQYYIANLKIILHIARS